MDWEIERRHPIAGVPVDDGVNGNGGGTLHHESDLDLDLDSDVTLWELRETWYVFPEVWKEDELVQESRVRY